MLHRSRPKDLKRTNIELKYLEDRGFVKRIGEDDCIDVVKKLTAHVPNERYIELVRMPSKLADAVMKEKLSGKRFATTPLDRSHATAVRERLSDAFIRLFAITFEKGNTGTKISPICWYGPQQGVEGEAVSRELVLKIALNQFPIPGPGSAWEDILAFREEMHGKRWHFRRFLKDLTGKKQTENEIKDDLEWTLYQYSEAMKIHNLKAGNSFVEVYVIPFAEFIEDLVTIKWSKIAKGTLGVSKREVELMEAEMKAPGRECAYVFDAQRRFGSKG
jgi:hypothetical protein